MTNPHSSQKVNALFQQLLETKPAAGRARAPEIHDDDVDPLPDPPLPENKRGPLALKETAAAAPTARPSVKANIHFHLSETQKSKFDSFTFPIQRPQKIKNRCRCKKIKRKLGIMEF